jgi:hypothetical protein
MKLLTVALLSSCALLSGSSVDEGEDVSTCIMTYAGEGALFTPEWQPDETSLRTMPVCNPAESGVDFKLIVVEPPDEVDFKGIIWPARPRSTGLVFADTSPPVRPDRR